MAIDKFIDDGDVLPHGKYALVRNLSLGPIPLAQLTTAQQLIDIAAATNLQGFVFRLFDSSVLGTSRWEPDPAGEDWQQVQWLFSFPGLIQQLKDQGLVVVGYSERCNRVAISNEVALCKWIHDTYTKVGPVLNVTAWIFDLTDADWSNDTSRFMSNGGECFPCKGQAMSTLCHWAEKATRAYFPLMLRVARTSANRPSNYWTTFTNDRSIIRTFLMPTLGHGEMNQASYRESYDSYQVGSQSQHQPRLEYWLDLEGADPTEVFDILDAFGSNNGVSGPNIGGGITLNTLSWTPTVGFVVLDDLEKIVTTPGMQAQIQAGRTPIYWDFGLFDGEAPSLVRLGAYDFSVTQDGTEIDHTPTAIVGQPFDITISFHSMKLNLTVNSHLFNYHTGTGLKDGFTWLNVNGAPHGPFGNGVVFGASMHLTGTPVDTIPTIFYWESAAAAQGDTFGLYLPIVAANTGPGASNPGRVTGATVQKTLPAANVADRAHYPPLVYGPGAVTPDYTSNIVWTPPWAVSPGAPGGGIITPGDGTGSGIYSEGPTTCFTYGGPSCTSTPFCIDNDLLNAVYNQLKGLSGFNLDFWAFVIALIQAESGWSNNNVHCDNPGSHPYPPLVGLGSQGLWQIEVFNSDGDLDCPGNGPLSDSFMSTNPNSLWTKLADPGFNTAMAIAKGIQGFLDDVNAAPGGWSNDGAIIETWECSGQGHGGHGPWCATSNALPIYHCIRAAVNLQAWPLPASSGIGGAVFCPIHAPISCNFDNGSRPFTCGPDGTYSGHVGTDFSGVGGSNFSINQVNPADATTWLAVSGAPAGGQIVSPVRGQVLFAGLDATSDFSNPSASGFGQLGAYNRGRGIGYYVEIEEETQLRKFRFGHFNLSSFLLVSTGSHVEMGQAIATGMGSRGNASGTHVHMEMYTRPNTASSYSLADPSTVLPAGCP